MTTRRQFLERSMLGFGGAFLLPSLLASCTDHTIPPVNPPIFPPPLGDYQIDWNDAAKTAVTTGLEMIPEAGEILGPLVDIFWPSTQEDVWGQVKAQVEAIVDQKIGDYEYGQVTQALQGLNNAMILYLNEVKNGTPNEILIQWISMKTVFVSKLPNFQAAGYELPLLGLFAQFANMYLALLRDAVVFGASWGRTPADGLQDLYDLQDAIRNFTTYTTTTYQTGRANLLKKTNTDQHNLEPFRTVNPFDRQMALTVLYFMDAWPYYDVTVYGYTGTTVVLNREIYSDPFGTCDNSGPIVLPSPPTQPFTFMSVWAGDRVDAVQLTYPAGSGPGGVTQTKRMGGSGGSNVNGQGGGTATLSPDTPLLGARATYGSIVNSMQFKFYDGTLSSMLGGVAGSNDSGMIGYYSEYLSSIHINGVSSFYGCADCVVFGFKYWQEPAATLNAVRTMYVKSPKERSVADFAKAFPKLAIPADLINNELKDARQAYWASLKARLPK